MTNNAEKWKEFDEEVARLLELLNEEQFRTKTLEAELSDAKHTIGGLDEMLCESKAEVERLEARIKETEGMLNDYGQHLPSCNASYGGNRKCTCGWDRERKALKELP